MSFGWVEKSIAGLGIFHSFLYEVDVLTQGVGVTQCVHKSTQQSAQFCQHKIDFWHLIIWKDLRLFYNFVFFNFYSNLPLYNLKIHYNFNTCNKCVVSALYWTINSELTECNGIVQEYSSCEDIIE